MTAIRESRLAIAEHPARRDHLHGAWWPRSTEVGVELAPMLTLARIRFGKVMGVALNRDEWHDSLGSWQLTSASRVKVSWYGLHEPNLAILHCCDQRHISLLILPPDTPEQVALAATSMACTPANSLTAADTLARARQYPGRAQPSS